MKVYQCDCCNKVISDPYKVKMKEFYVGVDIDYFSGIEIPVERKRKIKIDLIDHRDSDNKLKYTFYFENGIVAFLNYLIKDHETKPVHKNIFYVPKEHLHLLLQCKQCTEKSRKNNYV